MAFTPFDFNEAINQRREHAEMGLRYGSPVVGVSCQEAVALLTVRRSQRKVFEIYNRLMYSAIGNQSEIEAVRLGAVDLAAREGYERSPDDVTIQRLVGFALSPALKEVFRDQFRAPSVIRALFAELGDAPQDDLFYVLNYDGEFAAHTCYAVVAGARDAEDAMLAPLRLVDRTTSLTEALQAALRSWAIGVAMQDRVGTGDDVDRDHEFAEADVAAVLRDELANARVEIGILDRLSSREMRFRLFGPDEMEPLVAAYTGPTTDAV